MTQAEFLPLFDRYQRMVYALALSYTKSAQDAEDVCQSVFLRLIERPPSPGKERAWLAQVTVNRCKDLLRSPWRSRRAVLDQDAPLPDALIFHQPEEGALYSALLELKPELRSLIHLHYYEGFTVSELARQFGASPPAISARLYRAKRQLRSKMEELGYEEALSEDL